MKKIFICKHCKEVLLGDSPKCIHCGKDQRSFISRNRVYFIIGGMLVFFILFILYINNL